MFKHLLKEKAQDSCPKVFSKDLIRGMLKLLRAAITLCARAFCARLCILWRLSLVCLYSLRPWNSFHRNQSTMKEEGKWYISWSPLTKLWEVVEAWSQTALPWNPHRSSVDGKTVMYLEWFRVWNPSSQRTQGYNTALAYMGPMFYVSCRRYLPRQNIVRLHAA